MNRKTLTLNQNTLAYLFIAIFPIIPYYFNFAGMSFDVLFTTLFLIAIVVLKRFSIQSKWKTDGLKVAWFIWCACVAASNIIAGEYRQASVFVTIILAAYLCIASVICTKGSFLKALNVIINIYAVVCVLGIIESVTGFNAFSLLNTTNSKLNYNPARFGLVRIISFTGQTICYGVYVMFGLCLCMYLMQLSSITIKRKRQLKAIYILLWINLILTLSRSIILCAILSQLLLVFFMGMKRLLIIIGRIILGACGAYLICSFVFPEVAKMISNLLYMLLAVFDSDYQALISDAFGKDNLDAIGNRLDLYEWVFESMGGNWIWGHGRFAKFNYAYTSTNGVYSWTSYKSSIEVQYLQTLYRYGLVGLCTEIVVYVKLLAVSVKNTKMHFEEECRLPFNKVCLAAFICYFLEFFSLNQSSDAYLFYVLVMLFMAYNTNRQFREQDQGT